MANLESISFSKIGEILPPPDLLHIQRQSYRWFLDKGLRDLFTTVFPVQDVGKTLEMQFVDFSLEDPKFTPLECRERDMHYAKTLKVRFRLVNRETGEMKEQDVLFGALPVMTEDCTFIINGGERCVVSQLSRSAGIYFDDKPAKPPKKAFHCKVIPNRGSWVEMESHDEDGIVVRLERAKKIPATMLLKAIGFGKTTVEILSLFSKEEVIAKPIPEKIVGAINTKDMVDPKTEEVLHKGELISEEWARKEKLWKQRAPLTILRPHPVMLHTALKDKSQTDEEALLAIYQQMRPGDMPKSDDPDVRKRAVKAADKLISDIFFNPRRYDLGKHGRFQINKKFGIKRGTPQASSTALTREDFRKMIQYLLDLHDGVGLLDDVDHLGNRRVRAIGELLANHLRTALSRMAKMIMERMMIQEKDEISPQSLVNIRPVVAGINEFFGTGQLSQFLDQTNPLAELTHKRRLSAMGPGGLTRERAGIEVRDVHHTHYGRICPIETPEGPNIGLINSLCVYARVNEMGFIETPYRRVKDGKVLKDVIHLTADEEDRVVIAQANAPVDEHGYFKKEKVLCRSKRHHFLADPKDVEYMDISPKQIVSASASLIPFLEHDDANRALMGSNMQRQAVPLLHPEPPLVATGMERKVAEDSGSLIQADEKGEVIYADASSILVQTDQKVDLLAEEAGEVKSIETLEVPFKGGGVAIQITIKMKKEGVKKASEHIYSLKVPHGQGFWLLEPKVKVKAKVKEGDKLASGSVLWYELRRFDRSNQGNCIDQRPVVRPEIKIRKKQMIADGPACKQGELALGRNVLVAFLPWEGYNYEDAIVLSEKCVKEDTYTSIHVKKWEAEARDTKLGKEEITAEISNVPDDMIKNLDEDGIIRKGAFVKPDDILVGKITPKGETELTPEDRLLRAIFGEKAKEVRDTSLRVPHGAKGIVIGTKVFRRKEGFELAPGVNTLVRVQVAEKRRIQAGDKMSGRHGNKGVISRIFPEEDMPYLPDGTPVEIVLNPLGVPSRMNLGQILETHLGWVAHILGLQFSTPVFDGISEREIRNLLGIANLHKWGRTAAYREGKKIGWFVHQGEQYDRYAAEGDFGKIIQLFHKDGVKFYETDGETEIALLKLRKITKEEGKEHLVDQKFLTLFEVIETYNGYHKNKVQQLVQDAYFKETGKVKLYDGKTGEPYEQEVTVGYMYVLKLVHLAEEKIHARSTGPYALVTQQPLGGKAQFGGQRFGEMEVWALEAYGAASTLQELLTVKSDDTVGRVRTYEAIIRGEKVLEPGVPESFRVLVKEMKSLGIDVRLVEKQTEDKSTERQFEEALLSAQEEFKESLDHS